MKQLTPFLFLLSCAVVMGQTKPLILSNEKIKISWNQTQDGWEINLAAVKKGNNWVNLKTPLGENTLLFSAEKPKNTPDSVFKSITGEKFPEDIYHYQTKQWAESTNPVSLNTAGKAIYFFAKKG